MTSGTEHRDLEQIIKTVKSEVTEALKSIAPEKPILDPAQAVLPAVPQGGDIARLIDHTLLLAQYTFEDVERVCEEALRYGFATVCVNPIYIPRVAKLLSGSGTKPASVVGFIFGAEFPEIKLEQTIRLIDSGAEELDAVIAVGLLKAGLYLQVAKDLRAVIERCHQSGVLMKVILETGLLTLEEKIAGSLIAQHIGADYVKTCTGFAPGEATVDDIELLRMVVGDSMGVKAAGGIRKYSTALEMVGAGASRLGATQGVSICQTALEGSPSKSGDR